MKAMAIEGVTYGKRRKVTNSIIAQSEIKTISTGRTLRVVRGERAKPAWT